MNGPNVPYSFLSLRIMKGLFPPGTWVTRKVIAWALYDFGDTAFSALYVTLFFPVLIKVYLGGTEFQIGLAMGLSILVAAFLVPFVGALSDLTGRRMSIIAFGAFATAGIAVATGYVGLTGALALGFFANIFHLMTKDIYDAKMIDIVPRARFGILSGFGVGVGYFGTIVSLAVGAFLLARYGWDSTTGIRAVFWETAIFYIIFFVPLFVSVPDVVFAAKTSPWRAIGDATRRVVVTVRRLPRTSVFGRFLAASFFYNNAMNTAIIFLALYGREVIGMGVREFFPVFALMALASAAGSFVAGIASDRFGPIRPILGTLVAWIVIITVLTVAPSRSMFLLFGMFGGACLGAIWTFNRHAVLLIGHRRNIAELLGFEGLTEKFSGFLGPIVFGWFATVYGYTPALISVIVFFAIGLFLLRPLASIPISGDSAEVPVSRGR